MKITDLKVYVVDPSGHRSAEQAWTFVLVATAAGVTGIGQASNHPGNGRHLAGNHAVKCHPFLEMLPYHPGYLSGQIAPAGEELGVNITAAVREAVGPAVEIVVDAHGHCNVPTAVRLARRLEPYKIGWFEEPV